MIIIFSVCWKDGWIGSIDLNEKISFTLTSYAIFYRFIFVTILEQKNWNVIVPIRRAANDYLYRINVCFATLVLCLRHGSMQQQNRLQHQPQKVSD